MKRAIVLLSGGLDSAVTLYYAKRIGYKCHCLAFDYGQRHKRELEFAKKIAHAAGSNLSVFKLAFPHKGSSLLDKKVALPKKRKSGGIPTTYVPGRNIVFLSIALSSAEIEGAQAIFIGAHAQDYSGYPDCRPEFYKAFSQAARKGTKAGVEGSPIKIITPLIKKSKAEIIILGNKLKVPFDLTWSCYSGGKTPCGKCDSCYYRAKGFKEANLKDTHQYEG